MSQTHRGHRFIQFKKPDEFEIDHRLEGFKQFFRGIVQQERHYRYLVVVAMEGHRSLDTLTQRRNYRLFHINNLKLARFKEIFPAPAIRHLYG